MAGCKLRSAGWQDHTRQVLQGLISQGAGKRLPVVFDFDNTLIYGDVGEATLAVLVGSGKLAPATLPKTLCPTFRPSSKGRVSLESCVDLTAYYEALLAPTVHGADDPTPLATGYAWAVEIMAGLSPLEIVEATRAAWERAQPGAAGRIEVTVGRTGFPAPWLYPAMVELIGELLHHEYDVWIVSASNVWSVRWVVLEVLNPLLRRAGLRAGLRADQVVGVATLLADRRGGLYKDSLLMREDAGYAAMEPKALRALKLTSRLQFPVPIYSGKIACLFDQLGRNPYLCAGDAPGDHSMLALSRHRLWMARLEKPAYQEATAELIRRTGSTGWLVQPILAKPAPSWIASLGDIEQRHRPVPAEVRQSIGYLLPWLQTGVELGKAAAFRRPLKRH